MHTFYVIVLAVGGLAGLSVGALPSAIAWIKNRRTR
jgi:hypothetical protein